MVPIYRAEREDGLAAALADARLVLASVARPADPFPVPERTRARLAERAAAGTADLDLHYVDTVLVTVGWNKNDDVFDPVETWVARRTPEDKQLNYEHDDAQIVGHIVSNTARAADDEAVVGAAIPDDTPAEDLPPKFHLVTGAVLYKHWQTPDLQRRMDGILAKVAQGSLRVSMECLFRGFDYALRAADGTTRVVARTDKTAFLTKHLRAYGGTGQFNGETVGRVLRSIVFSGVGLVEKPANPESVILPPRTAAKIAHPPAGPGYASGNRTPTETRMNDLDALKAQVADLTGKLAQAQADLKAVDARRVADLTAELAAANDKLAKATEAAAAEKAELAAKLAAAEQAAAAAAAKAQAAEQEAAAAKAGLAAVEAERAYADRLAKVKAAYQAETDAEAKALLDAGLADLPADKFDAALAAMVKLGESKVSGLPAPMAGKPTPVAAAPVLPPAKPAPAGQAHVVKTATAGVAAATPTADPALAVAAPADDALEATRADVLAFFAPESK